MANTSRAGAMRRNLILIASGVAAFCCVFDAKRLGWVLTTPFQYQKDFTQFYLMGAALRTGRYIYTPLQDLTPIFHLGYFFDTPSPYPPVVAVIGLLFSYLPYYWAVLLWEFLEFTWFVISAVVIVKHFGGRQAPTAVIVAPLLFVCWRPVYVDIYLGQLMLFLTLLLTLAWVKLKTRHDVVGGLLLGLVLSIKLYAWPVAIYLLLRGRFKVLGAAAILFITINLAMATWLGPKIILDQLAVSRAMATHFSWVPYNFSLWAVGLRTFGYPAAIGYCATVLLAALLLAYRSNFEEGFMIMLVASTVLQPIAWAHGLVTLLPAVCFAVTQIKDRSRLSLALLLLLIALWRGLGQAEYISPLLWATWTPIAFVLGLVLLIGLRPDPNLKLKET